MPHAELRTEDAFGAISPRSGGRLARRLPGLRRGAVGVSAIEQGRPGLTAGGRGPGF